MNLQLKIASGILCLAGFIMVVYGAFGPGQGAGTPSGDLLDKIGFALMFFAIAIALITRRAKVR